MRKRGSPPKTPEATRQKVLSLASVGSQQWIAEQCGISQAMVSKIIRSLPADPLEKDKPQEPDRIEEFAQYHKEKFLHLQERFLKWVGDTAPKKKTIVSKNGQRKKILELNDIHAPFHNEEALAKAIRDNLDSDEVWIGGDLLDLFGVSRYPKSRITFSLVEEFQAGRAILRTLSETFPIVRVMGGNHDERWKKYLIAKNIPPDVLEFMRTAWPNSLSPLATICADFPNVHMLETTKVDYAEYGYISQMGDCLLSHAEKYSIIAGKTGVDVLDRIKKKLEPMGVVKPFKVLIQCHSHTGAKVWADYGVVIIEAGCLSRTPDYDGDPKLRGRQPVIGYVVAYQDNGVTDRNATNFIQLA